MKNTTTASLPLHEFYTCLNRVDTLVLQIIFASIHVVTVSIISYRILRHIDPYIDKLSRLIGSIFHSSGLT